MYNQPTQNKYLTHWNTKHFKVQISNGLVFVMASHSNSCSYGPQSPPFENQTIRNLNKMAAILFRIIFFIWAMTWITNWRPFKNWTLVRFLTVIWIPDSFLDGAWNGFKNVRYSNRDCYVLQHWQHILYHIQWGVEYPTHSE